VSGDFGVTVHHERLVGPVRVDADPAGAPHRVRRRALLPAELGVALELARVRGPHDDALGGVRHDGVVQAVGAVSVQRHHQVEVPLVRIGLALLAHVVGRGLAEVQAAHGRLQGLVPLQLQPVAPTRRGADTASSNILSNISPIFIRPTSHPRLQRA